MKSSFDLKHGIARITPESSDDLWILSDMITPGSLVKARTVRSVEVRREERKEKVGKRPMTLKIKVEKVELAESLRLGGKIIEGPEDISYGWHTLDITPGTFLTVEKEWKKWEVDKIRAAAKPTEPVHVAILDESEYDLYLVRERKRHLLRLLGPGHAKKEGKSRKPEYFGEIIADLKRREIRHLVIAGPGFIKDELAKEIREKEPELARKMVIEGCSHTGELGFSEVIKRKVLERITKQSRISEETAAVEKFLEELGKEGKMAYGLEEVKKAAQAGAVQTLLISDKKVRENEELMEMVDKTRGKMMIISSEHPAGERLLAMGGIAALLRYKLTE
ncbi:MAG: mRNA surveillance protein pelota [Candidatus Aenigmatarchaeota archaeon]